MKRAGYWSGGGGVPNSTRFLPFMEGLKNLILCKQAQFDAQWTITLGLASGLVIDYADDQAVTKEDGTGMPLKTNYTE